MGFRDSVIYGISTGMGERQVGNWHLFDSDEETCQLAKKWYWHYLRSTFPAPGPRLHLTSSSAAWQKELTDEYRCYHSILNIRYSSEARLRI